VATGWFQGGICYALQNEAIDAHFDAIPPQTHLTTTEILHLSYVKHPDGHWDYVSQSYSPSGSLTTNYTTPATTIYQAPCEILNDPTSNFLNGMELGWAVAASMVVVYVISRMKRGF
jgi:hypothetical protein